MANYQIQNKEYTFNHKLFEAYVAIPSTKTKKATILICHAWGGRDEFVENVARSLAEKGYVGVALDVYGKGVRGNTNEERMALMQPLLESRKELQGRLQAGLEVIQSLSCSAGHQFSAIGFCFGGLCVLDMARMELDLSAVISVHGLFNQPNNLKDYTIKPKVLALHGHLDPMVNQAAVNDFMQELDNSKADWQINNYGKALHAFTNPQANDHNFGTVFNQDIATRAWGDIDQFLNLYAVK